MYVMGIDSGSTSTNTVIMDSGQEDQSFFRGPYRGEVRSQRGEGVKRRA